MTQHEWWVVAERLFAGEWDISSRHRTQRAAEERALRWRRNGYGRKRAMPELQATSAASRRYDAPMMGLVDVDDPDHHQLADSLEYGAPSTNGAP